MMNPVQPKWVLPAYLVTAPQVVPDNSDSETSDSEMEVEVGRPKFTQKEFENPPFEIVWEKRGAVLPEDRLKSRREIPYQAPLIKKMETESFSGTPDSVLAKAVDRVGVVIGHNRMHSVSTSVNKRLVEQSRKYSDSPMLNREIHFFWRPQWHNTQTKKKVKLEVVRSFYRQFKRRNRVEACLFRREREQGITKVSKEALAEFYKVYKERRLSAKEFLAEREGKYSIFSQRHICSFGKQLKKKPNTKVKDYINIFNKNLIIPYREIREEIKAHRKTEECASELLKKRKRPLYMSIQDADVQSLQGVFSSYDASLERHFKKHKILPEVASGGYEVEAPLNPILEIGVLIELWVRHFTAQIFPTAVYYSEPNSLIKFKEGATVLEASFLGKKNYKSPQEMPTMIKDLQEKRGITDLHAAFLFDAHAALKTAVPKRMEKTFKAFYNAKGKVIRWSLADLLKYKSISQSHYIKLSWAKNLILAIGVPHSLALKAGTFGLKHDLKLPMNELSNLLVSLVGRLFAAYDPFEMAREKGNGFQKSFIAVLENYENEIFVLSPTKRQEKTGQFKLLWQSVDKVKSIEDCLQKIDLLFQKPGTGVKLQKAVKQSMEVVVEIYRDKFCLNFIELSMDLMMSFDKPITPREKWMRYYSPPSQLNLSEIGSQLHQEVLEKMLASDWIGKDHFKKQVKILSHDQRKGYLETYPMHWAAITGNCQAVRFLKSIQGREQEWIRSVNIPGKNGLLPLHCALRYCVDNGENLELIRELATKENVVQKCVGPHYDTLNPANWTKRWTENIVGRESPLLQALEELYHYPDTLKLLFEIADIPEIDEDVGIGQQLLELAELMREDAEGECKQKKILSFAIKENCSPKLIRFLIEWGAEFEDCKEELEIESPFSIAISGETTINPYGSDLERLKLLDILVNAGYNLHLIDESGLTPLTYAITLKNLPAVYKLIGHGVELSEKQRMQINQLQLELEGTFPVWHDEPIAEEMLERKEELLGKMETRTNITPKQKEIMLKTMRKSNESFFYYSEDSYGAQLKRQGLCWLPYVARGKKIYVERGGRLEYFGPREPLSGQSEKVQNVGVGLFPIAQKRKSSHSRKL